MEFLCTFLRCNFTRKPVVASWNVSYFLSQTFKTCWIKLNNGIYTVDKLDKFKNLFFPDSIRDWKETRLSMIGIDIPAVQVRCGSRVKCNARKYKCHLKFIKAITQEKTVMHLKKMHAMQDSKCVISWSINPKIGLLLDWP